MYHAIISNQHRIPEVRGAGCSSCGETNVRYDYEKLGQLVVAIKLNVNGEANSYLCVSIHGNSLLTRIDGPQPKGTTCCIASYHRTVLQSPEFGGTL